MRVRDSQWIVKSERQMTRDRERISQDLWKMQQTVGMESGEGSLGGENSVRKAN